MSTDYAQKIQAGTTFPEMEVQVLNGEMTSLGKPENGHDWKLVVVYRGKHCPICTKYLSTLETVKQSFYDVGVDIIAVSADSKEQLEGLYISDPRSEKETDHPFAEPAVFVINAEGKVHIVDISNAPFSRPDLEALANGLAFVRNPENNYPFRGMHG